MSFPLITYNLKLETQMNEVYISGAGCISAAGDGWRESAAGLYADAGVVPFPPSERIGSTLATPVFELTEFDPGNESKSMAFLHHALKEALDSAGLAAGGLRGKNVCVSIGTTVSCQLNNIPFYGKLRSGTVDSWEPLRNFFTSNPSERIRREYGLAGSALTVSNACVSGADAIALAYLNVASGACELAIAGGVDELNRVPIAGFNALGIASPEPCRPFDKKRRGLNLGEGAGVVILESGASLEKRKRRAEFVLEGVGCAGDAYHITAPHPDGRGLERAVMTALRLAGLSASDIAFVNAHGTGTENNDLCESALLSRVFGRDVRYLSTKGRTGHTLAAAGALELIFTLIMLERGAVPPSYGFEEKPENIAVPPVSELTPFTGSHAMSTSLAFGGCNTALIAGRV